MRNLLVLFLSIMGIMVNTNTQTFASTININQFELKDTICSSDSAKVGPNEDIDLLLNEKIEGMDNSWYINNAFDSKTNSITDKKELYSTANIPDSVFMERLKALNSAIDLSYNQTVRSSIAFYAERRREKTEIMLGLADYYMPMFEEILDKYNLPLELKYMAVIESALNPRAYSRAGASGLWQFMFGTGKLYNLKVDSWVDERRDPLKSTEAAAKYLKELYSIYNDWHMVIAAYNCGPGNVNKAIKRSGNKHNYWDIYYHLPKETRGYVPGFIAAAYIMNYYKLHNYTPRTPSFTLNTDTLMVRERINFQQIAQQLELDIQMLKDINPMYKRDVIPATANNPYPLVLPVDAIDKYLEKETEILAHKREEFFPDNQIKNPTLNTAQVQPSDVKGKDKVLYKVQQGDNVGFIADWFNIRVSDLRYWNNIRGNMIKAGQKLTIYVPEGHGNYYNNFNNLSFAEKQKSKGKEVKIEKEDIDKTPVTVTETKQESTVASNEKKETSETKYHYYTVKKGDNLWGIAKNFPGVTAESIQKLNGISNTRGLYIGQQLKILKY